MDAHDFICDFFSCRSVSKELADDVDYKLFKFFFRENGFCAGAFSFTSHTFVIVHDCSVARCSCLALHIGSAQPADELLPQKVFRDNAPAAFFIIAQHLLYFIIERLWDDGGENVCVNRAAVPTDARIFFETYRERTYFNFTSGSSISAVSDFCSAGYLSISPKQIFSGILPFTLSYNSSARFFFVCNSLRAVFIALLASSALCRKNSSLILSSSSTILCAISRISPRTTVSMSFAMI